uniref:Retrotransposon Copia-like N-terminal domain-containing protein n=1 Tax=Chenopodium quinoa TaxID=63459 RepID=A0A803MEU6_CHEQI
MAGQKNHSGIQNPTQDPRSVYYIHPSENPTVSLVSEKFNGENYQDWKRGMVLALSMKNKMSFIDGSLPIPGDADPLFNAWSRCNNMIISYILRSLDNTLAKSVIFFSTASGIWKDLEDRYSVVSGPQIYSLQQTLSQLERGSDSIVVFFTKIKGIWDQISAANPIPTCNCTRCTCNLTQKFLKSQQDERLIRFLMKLDTKHAGVRTNILMMNPLPNMDPGESIASCSITVANGKKVEVKHIGTVTFENGIVLKDVLHVLELHFNLISTHRICRDMDCDIIFTHDKCLIQDHSKKNSLVLGNLDSGMYAVSKGELKKDESSISSINLAIADEAKLLHLRLGHLPFNTWGPYKLQTHDNCSYFLTVVDDMSRHTWTFLMKNQSDCVEILEFLVTYI